MIEIEDILLGEILLNVSNIVRVYETKLEDNFNGTAVETNVFIYYTHEPVSSVLGKIDGTRRISKELVLMNRYKPQPIPRSWFSNIEKALDIELTDNQKYCLFNGVYPNWGGRQNGKTICDCIQLSLSVGEPIKKLTIFGDDDSMFPHEYARVLTDVNMKLYNYGFNTRRIGNVGGWHGFNYSNKKEK